MTYKSRYMNILNITTKLLSELKLECRWVRDGGREFCFDMCKVVIFTAG